MKPVPDTLETRRLAVIDLARATLAGDRLGPYPSTIERMQAVADLGSDATAQRIIAAQTAAARYTDMDLTRKCDACGEERERLVRVGEAPDYDSSTATLCRECLVEALTALDGAV
jgi:hypothetical protein